ncbi:hypothetical protein C2E23DRAFT_334735 [Lenzites betulinus]|nr:hypothetical protein C2E23DRAFT_334735 [Lenzites betulinus]
MWFPAPVDCWAETVSYNPFSIIPVLGGLSSALSPVLTPIGLPVPSKSSATATASATSTISLTAASETSASATSVSATSNTASAASTSATSDTSASASDTQTSATNTQQSSVTDATSVAAATPTPTPTPTDTSASLPASTVTNTSTVAASASASASSDAVNTPKSFLQNTALSVGVITAASLVGLVIIIAVATWAIRKRKRERLHQDILDFSSADLVDHAEKGEGSGGIGVRGTGSIGGASSADHGSSSSHGTLSAPQMQPRGMYENSGYPSMPAYAANPAARTPNPYAQPAYNDRGYAFPSQEQNNTYANWGYGYGNQQQQQNQFDQTYAGSEDAYGGLAYNDPHQLGAMAGVGAGAQGPGPQRRPSAHRKPPPQLYIPPANPVAETVATNGHSPISSVSITKPPLQAAGGMGAAQPARRTSLLNSPVVAGSMENGMPRERKDTLTHVELLDPSAPKMPALSPRLPDEFGAGPPPVSKDAPVEQPVRRLVVRNE